MREAESSVASRQVSSQPESSQGAYRILTIDGGGIKGVFAASFLAHVETSLGEPLVDHFDLMVGTSTGGIIALGLGLGLSAQDVLTFYEEHGPQIFNGHRRRLVRHLFAAKYSSQPLREGLEQALGDRRFGESLTRLVIPSMTLETGEVYVFKTAHHERFVHDYSERAVDVALATAAAPTYFPTHTLASGTPLIDGGTWANNPMGVAAIEALGVLGWPKGSVKLLGVGCTEAIADTYPRNRSGFGINYWARRIVSTFMAGQSSSALGTAQLLLGHNNVHRVSPSVGAGKYKLDDVNGIRSLKGLGATEARREFPQIKSTFLTGRRDPFVPFREVDA